MLLFVSLIELTTGTAAAAAAASVVLLVHMQADAACSRKLAVLVCLTDRERREE